MEKITVIIPVYNAASFLERSVNSVINQTFANWELILVDDGSKDRSGQICDEFAQRDNRVCVIHQENAGAGAARNAGIEIAKGEYIIFVDSDDMIEPDYMELLSKHNEDLVFIDVDRVDEQGKVLGKEYLSKYKGLKKDEILRSQMTGRVAWGGVRKCVKRELLTKNNIWYSNHKIGEEAIYSYLVLRFAQTVGFIEKPVYHYLQHGDSLSNSVVDDPWGDVALALRDKAIEVGDYSEYGNTINAFIETAAIVSVYKMAQHYPYNVFRQKAKERWSQMQIDKDVSLDKEHQSRSIRLFGTLVTANLWVLAWAAGKLRGR